MLKIELALRRHHSRRDRIITHRQDPRGNSPRSSEIADDSRQRISLPQALSSQHVQSQVAVAQIEPIFAAQRPNRFHESPAFLRTAPALDGISFPRQRIKKRIDVRRDGEPQVSEVIAGIDDCGHIGSRYGMTEP
jgi:hypothetical protein